MPRSPLYPYPPVQYIPLYLEPIFFQEPVARGTREPVLLIGEENIAGQPGLAQKYGCTLPQLPYPALCREKLLILTAGFEPLEAKYRGCYVTFKARSRPCLGLYYLPAKYFYRSSLVFQIKNANGEKLLAQSYRLPAGTLAPACRLGR